MFKKSDIKDAYPLTSMQEGMLYHYLMGERNADHFKQISYRIVGEIDLDLFERALNILIQRYDPLRTIFVFEKVKKPLQVVLKKRNARIHFQDISSLEEEEKQSYVEEFKNKDRKQGFDLSKDILMRYSVLKLSETVFEIIMLHHHIITFLRAVTRSDRPARAALRASSATPVPRRPRSQTPRPLCRESAATPQESRHPQPLRRVPAFLSHPADLEAVHRASG